MQRLATVPEFRQWQESLREALDPDRAVVTICGGTGCSAFGSGDVQQAFEAEIQRRGLQDEVSVKRTGCHGFCEKGPVVVLLPSKVFYPNVQVEDVPEIVEKTVVGGEPIERLLYVDVATGRRIAYDHEVPFYAGQQRLVFRLNGIIDPVSIEDYVANEGYSAIAEALGSMSTEQVIEEVRGSGLRGRGGAGFPTGLKWSLCRKEAAEPKYLICNSDEGDPGAFMDRSLLEGTPHAIIEGMLIAAYAIGATQGIVYVRAEYPLAVKNIRIALEQARECGLLGDDILGSGFKFDIEVREGAGAFVCGEESALIASLEGERGTPRPRPPYPVQRGYLGKPTTINNVETLANVPLIVLKGADWYQETGTEGSPGTKIFALAGKVNNTGLVEVPMGTRLREIVFDIGGGIWGDRKFKAVQLGGPSGGCLPAQYLDMPVDYESVKELGAIMGSGGMIVMDENTCMVDIARYFLEFTQSESCGKCVPCRVGTRHMLDILERICAGQGRMEDLDELERLARHVKSASLCGLGQTAPNPVLTTLQYFREEYEEHIKLGRCRACVCEELVSAPCAHACPAGVNVPQYVALIAEGHLEAAVDVIRRRNPFVSVCGRVCDSPCEARCRRIDLDEPLAIRALKRYATDRAEDLAPTLMPPATGEAQVAVVGAGPSGLTCAYFLALMGRPSVVFEKQPVPGGMLALGIPEYRLPKGILQEDIDFILRHGVELRTETPVERAADLLDQGFQAVYLATGAQEDRKLGIEGEDLEGVLYSLPFLRARGLGLEPDCGGRVAVIGGGNAAVDAARSALRLGADQVAILYRRTRRQMPAYEEEIEEALREGVELQELVSPRRIVGQDGRVTGIEMIRMELGDADESGRRRPEPVAGSEFVVECDMVIPAIGQVASVGPARELELSERKTVVCDLPSLETSREGIFAGGDVVKGGGTVIEAIGDGQRAAIAIDRYLGGAGQLPPDVAASLYRAPEEELQQETARLAEPLREVGERTADFREVVCGITPDGACAEARRCLRCDLEDLLS
ncbi:MAG: NADH-ubiquinone oxidoreductase-F iron-sulfur binding region domain-containing protein [Candidatus Brocadiia bacterium]